MGDRAINAIDKLFDTWVPRDKYELINVTKLKEDTITTLGELEKIKMSIIAMQTFDNINKSLYMAFQEVGYTNPIYFYYYFSLITGT